jgi:CRISPR-associated protein Csm1
LEDIYQPNDKFMSTTQGTSYNYFIKGDLSGIQDFIFNVKSEKAARVLKARSILIQVLSEFAEKHLTQKLKGSWEGLYNGGGSFYGKLSFEGDLEKLRQEIKTIEWDINQNCYKEDIYIVLSAVPFYSDFSKTWGEINYQSEVDKLGPFSSKNAFSPFLPYEYDAETSQKGLKGFAHFLPKKEAEITNAYQLEFHVYEKAADFLGSKLALTDFTASKDYFENKIHNKLPEWREALFNNPYYQEQIQDYNQKEKETSEHIREGHIIDYKFLAKFAYERTGTNKLAVLKMDVDNLGLIFHYMTNEQTAKRISDHFSEFFSIELNRLLDDCMISGNYPEQEDIPYKFRDNIYTIFAGGDDSIFVGGWDAILKWAQKVQESFKPVAEEVKGIIQDSGISINLPITLSAGIVFLDPTYPVIRFADLSEDAIGKAKSFRYFNEINLSRPQKNKVTIFNQCLSWEEYQAAGELAKKLQDWVTENKESRSLLERIKNSASGFEKLQKRAIQGDLAGPQVAKLFYFVRNRKEAKAIVADFIESYSNDLIKAFVNKEPTNPMKYPIAARWAEFLTRKNK